MAWAEGCFFGESPCKMISEDLLRFVAFFWCICIWHLMAKWWFRVGALEFFRGTKGYFQNPQWNLRILIRPLQAPTVGKKAWPRWRIETTKQHPMPFVACMARSPTLALWKVPQTGFFLPFSMGMLTTTRYSGAWSWETTYLFIHIFWDKRLQQCCRDRGSLMYAISTYFYRFLDKEDASWPKQIKQCLLETKHSREWTSDNIGKIHYEIPEFMKGHVYMSVHLPPSI